MTDWRVDYITIRDVGEGGYTRTSFQSAWDTAMKCLTKPDAKRVMIYRYDEERNEWREVVPDVAASIHKRLSVTQVASLTGFNRSYIQSEAAKGNLKAELVGNSYVMDEIDYLNWFFNNPRRGTVSNARKSDEQTS